MMVLEYEFSVEEIHLLIAALKYQLGGLKAMEESWGTSEFRLARMARIEKLIKMFEEDLQS